MIVFTEAVVVLERVLSPPSFKKLFLLVLEIVSVTPHAILVCVFGLDFTQMFT